MEQCRTEEERETVREIFRRQNGERDRRRMTEYNARKNREREERERQERERQELERRELERRARHHAVNSYRREREEQERKRAVNSQKVRENPPLVKELPVREESPKRKVLFNSDVEEIEELDYSSDTEFSHDKPVTLFFQEEAEVRKEGEIGGVSRAIVNNLDIQDMKTRLREAREEGDGEEARQIRSDIWILQDLKAGIVERAMTDVERKEAIDRMVDRALGISLNNVKDSESEEEFFDALEDQE